MKNPYEKVGIIASVVILVAVLAVGLVIMNTPYEYDSGPRVTEQMKGQIEKYVPWVPKLPHDYYNSCPDEASDPEGYDACHKIQEIQECKKTSKDYEEFFDCVHCPDPVKCEMKWDWMDNQK